jgi:hypothetical protein
MYDDYVLVDISIVTKLSICVLMPTAAGAYMTILQHIGNELSGKPAI